MTPSTPRDTQIAAHVLISGRVQGVGYRASTWDMAQLLKLTGWVRNLRDGRVEALFEGDRAHVEAIIRWCHQGPPAAVVAQVSVEYQPSEGLRNFEVKPSH
jgi:acylphosphatase